jgi:hypothetical protein
MPPTSSFASSLPASFPTDPTQQAALLASFFASQANEPPDAHLQAAIAQVEAEQRQAWEREVERTRREREREERQRRKRELIRDGTGGEEELVELLERYFAVGMWEK